MPGTSVRPQHVRSLPECARPRPKPRRQRRECLLVPGLVLLLCHRFRRCPQPHQAPSRRPRRQVRCAQAVPVWVQGLWLLLRRALLVRSSPPADLEAGRRKVRRARRAEGRCRRDQLTSADGPAAFLRSRDRPCLAGIPHARDGRTEVWPDGSAGSATPAIVVPSSFANPGGYQPSGGGLDTPRDTPANLCTRHYRLHESGSASPVLSTDSPEFSCPLPSSGQ